MGVTHISGEDCEELVWVQHEEGIDFYECPICGYTEMEADPIVMRMQ